MADGGAVHLVRTQGRDHERRAATATFARLGSGKRFQGPSALTMNGVLTRNEMIVELTG